MGEPMPVIPIRMLVMPIDERNWDQFLRERGQRIREARLGKRISRDKLAELLNASPGSIGNWERGDCAVTPHHLIGLSIALGVSLEYLQGEEVTEEPEVKPEAADAAESLDDDESIPEAIERLRLRVAAHNSLEPSRVRVIIEIV
jgi:transcriptional regulator with XRE-family HTH domain